MSSRMIAALISTVLPTLAAVLPMSSFHFANALVCGILATVLAGFSEVDNRARYGAAVIGAWVGLVPLFVDSTLVETALAGSWGVGMVTMLIGPFSGSHTVTWVRPAVAPAAVEVPAEEAPTRAAA
jgi:hypothetical protein